MGSARTEVKRRRFRSSPGRSNGLRSSAQGMALVDGGRSRAWSRGSFPREAGWLIRQGQRQSPAQGPQRRPGDSVRRIAGGELPGKSDCGTNRLAYFFRLAVEVLNAAARENEVGVGFEFAAGPVLAFPAGLVDGQLVFQRKQDQTHGGNHFAHDANLDQESIGGRIGSNGAERSPNRKATR